MKLSSLIVTALAAAALLAAPAARAQDGKLYVGGFLGQGSVNFCGQAPAGVTCDDKALAWKAFVGAQVNEYVALEVGYGRTGELSASGPGGSLSVKATAVEAVGIFSYPVTQQVHPYLKFGVYHGWTKFTSTVSAGADESNNDLTYGLGVRLDITKQLAVRAEFQRYKDVGGPTIGHDDVDVIGVGVLFRF